MIQETVRIIMTVTVATTAVYAGAQGNNEPGWWLTPHRMLQTNLREIDASDVLPMESLRTCSWPKAYYCYTEVFFDEAQEMLLAIASDDAAKIWVNDFLVWGGRRPEFLESR